MLKSEVARSRVGFAAHPRHGALELGEAPPVTTNQELPRIMFHEKVVQAVTKLPFECCAAVVAAAAVAAAAAAAAAARNMNVVVTCVVAAVATSSTTTIDNGKDNTSNS